MMRRLPDGTWLNLALVTHVEVEKPWNSHPGALFRFANDRVVSFGGTRFETVEDVQAWLDEWLGDAALDGEEHGPVHVDPINGDDANDGSTEATAKRTVGAAVEAAKALPYINGGVCATCDGTGELACDADWSAADRVSECHLTAGCAGLCVCPDCSGVSS